MPGTALLLLLVIAAGANAVGPDLKARARLLRDLPMGFGGVDAIPPKERDRTLIDMSLSVRSLDLDFEKGTFRTDGYMKLRWSDKRYIWDPASYDGIDSVPLPFSQTWSPEVILHNSVEEKFIYRRVGVVRHTGEIVYVVSVHTKSACEPNYESYPFGMQLCSLKFGSWVNGQYKVEYRMAPNETAVGLDEFSSPNGWRVVAAESRLESRRDPLFEEPSRVVVFDLAFVRERFFDLQSGSLIEKPYVESNGSIRRHEHERGDQEDDL